MPSHPGIDRVRPAPGLAARALVLAALLGALGGCGSVPVTTHAEVDDALKLSAVVLEPVRGAASADASALGDRLTLVTLEAVAGQALVWGGGEVQVLHPDRRDWTATSAVPLLRGAAIRLEEAVVVRARLETAQASSQQEVRGAGGAAVGAAEELRWRATVEILHPSTSRVLVEATAEARSDPFSSGSAEDAASQPGDVLGRAAAEALARLSGRWTPPRAPKGPLLDTWVVVPSDETRLGHGLEAEVQRLGRLRTANPGLDETEAARLARLPPGVFIRQAPPGSRLRTGELVLHLDAGPVGPAALARARFAPVGVLLEVRSPDGRLRRVNFP